MVGIAGPLIFAIPSKKSPHSGSFSFSGRSTGRGAGVLTLNPQGLHHGPKRADLEQAQKEWRRDARLEGCTVNVDCFGALEVTPEADAPEAKYAF